MPADTHIEILKRCARAVFTQYFYLTRVVLGLILIIVSTFIPTPTRGLGWQGVAKKIGETILIASVVTTFMRFFASLDIVGEKIEAWLTSGAYLQKLTSRLSLAVCEPRRAKHLGDLRML